MEELTLVFSKLNLPSASLSRTNGSKISTFVWALLGKSDLLILG